MTQTADPTLAMKRVMKDQSYESEGKHVVLLLEQVGFGKVYIDELLSSPVEWISLDLICRLLDKFVLLFMFFLLMVWKITHCFVLFCICGGDGSHLKRG